MGDAINWQTIGVLVAMLAAFSAVVLMAVRTMLNANQTVVTTMLRASQTHIDGKLLLLTKGIENNNEEWQRIEKDFLRFQAVLPEKYIARDDWIRFSNLIDAKVDTLSAYVQQLLERTKKS